MVSNIAIIGTFARYLMYLRSRVQGNDQICALLVESLEPLDRILVELSKFDPSSDSKLIIRKVEITLDKFMRYLHKRTNKGTFSKYWDESKERTKIKMHLSNIMLLLNEHHAVILKEVQVDLKQLPEKIEKSLKFISSQAVTDIKRFVEESKNEIIYAIDKKYNTTPNPSENQFMSQTNLYHFDQFYIYFTHKNLEAYRKISDKENEFKSALKYYFILKDYKDHNIQALLNDKSNLKDVYLNGSDIDRFNSEVWDDLISREKFINDFVIIPKLSERNPLAYQFSLLSYSNSTTGSLVKGQIYGIQTKISRGELKSGSISEDPLANANFVENNWYLNWISTSNDRIYYLLYDPIQFETNLIFFINSFGASFRFFIKTYSINPLSVRNSIEISDYSGENYDSIAVVGHKNQEFEIIGNMKLSMNADNKIYFESTNENPVFIRQEGLFYLNPTPDTKIFVDISHRKEANPFKVNSSTLLFIGGKKFKAILY